MKIYRKELVDLFSDLVKASYIDYCGRHSIPQNTDTLLNFLFTQELFSETTIRRYTIQSEFGRMSKEGGQTKTKVVRLLADRFNISDRMVWNVIKSI